MPFYFSPSKSMGFTLIELMMVVSIIGILALIAIPSYQNYTQRARFSEVIVATQPFKIAIALALQDGVPSSQLTHGVHGIPLPPKKTAHLDSINIENGLITAKATERIDNHTYILKPNLDGSAWSISGTCLKHGLCRD